MVKQDLAILYSGGSNSLSLYVLASLKKYLEVPPARTIHLLNMINGATLFSELPHQQFKTAQKILTAQAPKTDPLPDATLVQLDMSNLFQKLWLDRWENMMPEYNNKNLTCSACLLAMHTRAVIYCVEHSIPNLLSGYVKKQSDLPVKSELFIKQLSAFSTHFGIISRFPLFDVVDDDTISRFYLHDHGIPSTDEGDHCLFSKSMSTATEKEITQYVNDVIPELYRYVDSRLEGRIRESAMCFVPDKRQEW